MRLVQRQALRSHPSRNNLHRKISVSCLLPQFIDDAHLLIDSVLPHWVESVLSLQAAPEAFKRVAMVVGKPKPKKRVGASVILRKSPKHCDAFRREDEKAKIAMDNAAGTP